MSSSATEQDVTRGEGEERSRSRTNAARNQDRLMRKQASFVASVTEDAEEEEGDGDDDDTLNDIDEEDDLPTTSDVNVLSYAEGNIDSWTMDMPVGRRFDDDNHFSCNQRRSKTHT